MATPTLKQFLGLSEDNFECHPVWIACHVADYDEPWYDETDDETFRPYTGPLPADPTDMLLVRAAATMSDGSQRAGFLTPAQQHGDLGTLQPHVFAGDAAYGFWGGIIGVPEPERRAFLAAVGKAPKDVFPIRFISEPCLSAGVVEAEVAWWLEREIQDEPAQPRRRWRRSR